MDVLVVAMRVEEVIGDGGGSDSGVVVVGGMVWNGGVCDKLFD